MKPRPSPTPTDALGATIGMAIAADLQGLIARLVAEGIRTGTAITPESPPRPDGHASEAPWMTPPSASRVTGVPLKTIRSFIRARRIEARLRNSAPNPKQRKYLVNAAEVARIATIPSHPSYPPSRMDAVTRPPDGAKPDEWVRGRLAPVAPR